MTKIYEVWSHSRIWSDLADVTYIKANNATEAELKWKKKYKKYNVIDKIKLVTSSRKKLENYSYYICESCKVV